MIIMEHLNFGARGDQGEFGTALAKMHAAKIDGAEEFGFEVNNTIGLNAAKERADDEGLGNVLGGESIVAAVENESG